MRVGLLEGGSQLELRKIGNWEGSNQWENWNVTGGRWEGNRQKLGRLEIWKVNDQFEDLKIIKWKKLKMIMNRKSGRFIL